ncbi:hypothetical protein YC2023_082385 [Brassica napus]
MEISLRTYCHATTNTTDRCFRNVYSDLSVRNTDSSVSVHKITRGVVYWSDLFSGQEVAPVTNLGSSDETGAYGSPKVRKSSRLSKIKGNRSEYSDLNSLITTPVQCPTDVTSSQVHLDVSSSSMSEGYPRSLLWQFSQGLSRQSCYLRGNPSAHSLRGVSLNSAAGKDEHKTLSLSIYTLVLFFTSIFADI